MSSCDGRVFQRWGEAFLRPGPQTTGNWFYGDNYLGWGLIETPSGLSGAPRELSLFATENTRRQPGTRIRRYTLRLDGFVSVEAPLGGGGFTTRPLQVEGHHLVVNIATSAAGSLRVGLLDASDSPLPGFSADECVPVIGDDLERTVRWRGGGDVATVTRAPVRLQVRIADADLYSFQFRP